MLPDVRQAVLTCDSLGPQQSGPGLIVFTELGESAPVQRQRRSLRRRPWHPVGHREQRRQDCTGAFDIALLEPCLRQA